MKLYYRTKRICRIFWVLFKFRLLETIFPDSRFFKMMLFLNFYPKLSRGSAFRLAIEELGPIFIKAGQVLSTRRDILSEDIALELIKLQDRVPPFSSTLAEKIIEHVYEKPVLEVFKTFDPKPIASASIAQVHEVTLHDDTIAIIKILRPHIHKKISRDVDLLYVLARFLNRFFPSMRAFKPLEIVDEIATTLRDEVDLMREAANASQLRRNFKDSSLLYVPEIYWDYCRTNALVMEKIFGIPIHDVERIQQSGINLKRLAERGLELFFTQVFRDSYFHADMHPGNFFVAEHNKQNPLFIAVDFGIMGALNSQDKHYLAGNMLAFFKRDYNRVAELHIASGWLPPDTRIDQFASAIRVVCEPIFERPIGDISFGQLLMRLFQAARRFNMNIQPQLILLQKTFVNIEGLGRSIYPQLDMWATAKPYLEKWLKEQVGVKSFFCRIRENLPLWSEKLPELPNLFYEVLSEKKNQMEKDKFYGKNIPEKTLYSYQNLFILFFIVAFVEGFYIFYNM